MRRPLLPPTCPAARLTSSLTLVLTACLAACLCAGLAAPPAAASSSPAAPAGAAAPGTIDPSLLAGMRARSIGPAAMSGRIVDIKGVETDPLTVYVGAATSGIWKTANGGLTWAPIFDDQPVHSIGAIAIFPANPNVVWVGTGEGNTRNSASVGNGVYRSLDAGRTWQHVGLDKTEHIRRIVLHPTDPDVAYVAAEGREWGENPERGIFKTTDGGRSWKRILYVDERTGGAELAMDPGNPNKIFAGMWQFRRWPWGFRSGGPGSGLYVTLDGGDTWKKLTADDGLPKGLLGRIGVAFARSQPSVVYALVEAEGKNAVLRSDDGGASWQTTNTDADTTERPFYYAEIRVDPQRPNRLYDLTSRLRVSEDGGRTFHLLGQSREIHGDYHALWIDPNDSRFMVVGEDGGVGISRDRGENWQFAANLPFGQFYHVAVDNEVPYNVYGGLQDNGAWRGPSSVWENAGVRNAHWVIVGGGDGFVTLPDPHDAHQGYSEAQGGDLQRFDLRTGERKTLRPPELSTDPAKRLRFNWNTGLAEDPFDPATIYYGSQYLLKSTDRGDTWTVASPDLTTNNPDWQHQDQSGGLTLDASGAENYCTIIAIAPSAVERGVLWVGTDDGRVQVTRDGGKSWTSVEANIPGVPAHTWVPQIRASHHAGGSAFVVFDDHRRSNWTPYVYRTDDYGKTWKSLATPNLWGYALAIEQDPVDRDLLFLGTEFALYVSLDGGAHWLPWKHGLPTTSVMDLVIQPRDADLVLGTHGRSIYILDDITPLRQLTAATLSEPLHLYVGMPALEHPMVWGIGAYEPGGGEFHGENRPYGAILTYSLNLPDLPLADQHAERERRERQRAERLAHPPPATPATAATATGASKPAGDEAASPEVEAAAAAAPEEEEPENDLPSAFGGSTSNGPRPLPGEPQVEIRISNHAGKVVRTFKGTAHLGVNRAVWDLTRDPFDQPHGTGRGFFRHAGGPQVPPGTYDVAITFKGHTAHGTVRVDADPDTHNTAADWQAREALIARAGALQNALVEGIARIAAAKSDVQVVIGKLRRAEERRRESHREAEQAQHHAPGEPEAPPAQSPEGQLLRAARDLERKLDAAERRLHVPSGNKGIVDDRTPLTQVEGTIEALDGSWDPPDASERTRLQQADAVATAALAELNRFLAADVAAFSRQAATAHIDLLPEEKPLEVAPPPAG